MKKLLIGAVAAMTVLSIGVTGVSAACAGMRCNYTDADGDGICDNAGYTCPYNATQNNGSFSYGANYIDVDGDGVCDHFANRPYRQGGRGNGFHGGRNNR
ncbi:MAG TPA: hypothetical protein IAC74_08030 [Candidatus Aphodoplasma excrementigallinarum]|uniref:Lipoprotein n=1 Tax=Candidatus Aphodoplasma excrementigallinarum TaxID=2840673 RepID=A0A9D1NI28_9FIRM|nr:hypothetical protein [Candidatus Aphodoplasma excrementigallinarum]